ncbi:hypothetical protein EXM22_01845 [Oceanispirochaeta crateris]|uniref:Uncharacterized protein n=1 Tax=Oceanispirochaeta crateris TaxID=2518645 RepID=A0A5C1QKX2_9SPIO|nr:hypothetical protein [Oceanispirochaeta crateris]QEN06792.1 hypothetical protein EXM22_01845 [Oceanispirochaeta crateris]
MKERLGTKGRVRVRVLSPDGRIKRSKPGLFRRILGFPGKLNDFTFHNVVTTYGDALLANLAVGGGMTAVDSANGHIEVGTGWTGLSPKDNTGGCNTPTGTRQGMDNDYPATKGTLGESADDKACYRATFPAGSLDATGINEAALMNASSSGICLAYAQITPEVNIGANDILQIDWEITFYGT